LVGLAVAQGHDEAGAGDGEVGDVEGDELGAAEGTSEAEQ